MFDTLDLVVTSFTSCLFTYFKIERQHQTFMSLFSFITDINKILKFRPPVYFDHPFIKFNKDLRSPSPFILKPPVYYAPRVL